MFTAIVEREKKLYVARVAEIELASQGKTIDEALANLREALILYLKHADSEELQAIKRKSLPFVVAPLDVQL